MADRQLSKPLYGVLAGFAFTVVTLVTPIPDAVRLWLAPTAWALMITAIFGYMITGIKKRTEYSILAGVFVVSWLVVFQLVRGSVGVNIDDAEVRAQEQELLHKITATQKRARALDEKIEGQLKTTSPSFVRRFVAMSGSELLALYRGKTDYQGAIAVAGYIDKWLTISGVVRGVTRGGSGEGVDVYLRLGRDVLRVEWLL